MTKSVPHVPGQTALIDRDELPEGSIREPNPITCYADWTAEAEPYLLDRASRPGQFTYFDAVKDAPAHVRNAPNRCWPGLYTSSLHSRGVLEYALDLHGNRVWDTSHKPESGGSAVAVWVGVEGMAGGAA